MLLEQVFVIVQILAYHFHFQHLPQEGIKIFANTLHTHLAG